MSFFVELRHWMLKGSIALEVGEESVVRDDGLVAALGYDGEIFQVFEQLLVIANGQHDCRAVAVLVREILQGLAHGQEATPRPPQSRARAATRQPRKGRWHRERQRRNPSQPGATPQVPDVKKTKG